MTGTIPAAVAGAAAIVAIPLIAATLNATSMNPAAGTAHTCRTATAPAVAAADSIPADYLARYQSAGKRYGISWQVLAGVGKVESDHGRATGPAGVGVRTGANTAGAMGPMQFLPGTWRTYGVDGDHDGRRDVYDPDDAIPAAARYLKHSGAPTRLQAALFTYNHSADYVRLVLAWTQRYASPHQTVQASCPTNPPQRPGAANPVVEKVIAYARAQIGKPYVWGTTGPDAFDCSGLTLRAYQAAGITIPRVAADQWAREPHIPDGHEQPGDLVFFTGADGTKTRPGHVGIVIGNAQAIAAPHRGEHVKIQSYAHRKDLIGFTRPR